MRRQAKINNMNDSDTMLSYDRKVIPWDLKYKDSFVGSYNKFMSSETKASKGEKIELFIESASEEDTTM